ncbi:dihydropteroate synthase, partial [Candidatus Hakubella thermalkaliphila]
PMAVLTALEAAHLPFCIYSSNRHALVAALQVYPGVALVNSVNGEEESLKKLLPAIKKHNAVVIGLTMDDVGIPTDPDKRFEIAKKIVERAQEEGIPKENILIDCLAMAVSADPNAGIACLKAIGRVTEELGVGTTLGASNVSFGMPNRSIINKAF